MSDVIVIGGGLIGLAIAHELAGRGAVVRVFDRGEPGHGASWAGAGMLAPYAERIDDDAMLALCRRSLARYPSFVAALVEESGIEVELALDGIVEAAFDDERLAALRAHAERCSTLGLDARVLDRREAMLAEPSLGRTLTGALVIAGQGYVDNRRLGRALLEACRRRGVLLNAPVSELRLECDARRVRGVRTDLGFAAADVVVNAAGAWAAQVDGIPARAVPAVTPVKGQMLALAAPVGFLRRTTWVPGAYLVPRADGRLLVGATVEDAGFDQRVTAEGIRRLLDAALAAAPALGNFTITESWAGLRPGTPSGRPIIGPAAIDGLILATGHYRNGILLTPETAHLVASFVETGDVRAFAEFLPRESDDQRRGA
jgi:glycine oxidase